VAACLIDGVPAFDVLDRFDRLLAAVDADEPVLVDIPIGLREAGPDPRDCDVLARRLLGPRRSSVFPAPIRAVLECATYDEANATHRRMAAGKGLSRQTFHLMPRIVEVDRALRADPARIATVAESHPEVCFRSLAGGVPMTRNKRTAAGSEERLRILGRCIPRGVGAVRRAIATLAGRAARDDVIDAAVLAVTAALPAARRETLPSRPERDAHGLPMRMVVPRVGD
jgi:predicted RNase H-like nuclease